MLPEDCWCEILGFTSPQDACRSSVVSSAFRSASMSDAIWDKFLPPHYPQILAASVHPLPTFSSKKHLFLSLCNPLLIDGGKKSFTLDKNTGKTSYVLSARDLSIPWSDVPTYWTWVPTAQSRFSEVAVLRSTSWLGIEGKLRTQMLSPNTAYGAHLILKVPKISYGFDSIPSETYVEVGGRQVSCNKAYLSCYHQQYCSKQQVTMGCVEKKDDDNNDDDHDHHHTEIQLPKERGDGWMEVELGEFFVGGKSCDDDDHQEVKMSLKEVKGYQLKGGLVIDGIEVRPKFYLINN